MDCGTLRAIADRIDGGVRRTHKAIDYDPVLHLQAGVLREACFRLNADSCDDEIGPDLAAVGQADGAYASIPLDDYRLLAECETHTLRCMFVEKKTGHFG